MQYHKNDSRHPRYKKPEPVCQGCGTEWLDNLDYCPICDGDNGETYLIESTTLDNWSG